MADTVGGVRTFVRELAAALSARDVEAHLALLGSEAPELAAVARSTRTRDLRLEWMAEPWADVKATGEWIEELAAELAPDLIHMNTFAPVRADGIPVLLTVHSDVLTWWRAVHGRPAPPEWERYRRLVRAAVDRAELIVTPSRALRVALRAAHGRLPQALVIPNGLAAPPGSGEPHRRRLVVTVGRLWDPAKNAELLVRAAPRIRGEVALIGEPGSERRVEGAAGDGRRAGAPGDAAGGVDADAAGGVDGDAAGGVDGRAALRWLGPLPRARVIDHLCRAAVFAEPARYEPFGLAALEAALCGCALVLGDIPSLREVWGRSATYVSPQDPEALAEAVNRLLEDPSARAAAARRARRAALRRTPQAMADAYLRAYARAAGCGQDRVPAAAGAGRPAVEGR